MATKTLLAQQLLFGYRSGHRLLSGSTSLNAGDSRTALYLSDLSGHSADVKFSSYYTFYPLSSYYVASQTWYAPEQSRPGCVWTHCLLLDYEAIAAINASAIFELFRRPSLNEPFSFYESPLPIVAPDHVGLHPNEVREPLDQDLASRIAAQFFQTEAPVFVTAVDGYEMAPIFVHIWLLHRVLASKLAWCSGSLEPRKVGDKLFDLQAAPVKAKLLFERADLKGLDLESPAPFWSETIVNAFSNDSELGSLLEYVGRGLLPPFRRTVSSAAGFIASMRASNDRLGEYVSLLFKSFEQIPHDVTLESALLNEEDEQEQPTRRGPWWLTESERIIAIAHSRHELTFVDPRRYDERVQILCDNMGAAARIDTLSLLNGNSAGVFSSILSERILKSLADEDDATLRTTLSRIGTDFALQIASTSPYNYAPLIRSALNSTNISAENFAAAVRLAITLDFHRLGPLDNEPRVAAAILDTLSHTPEIEHYLRASWFDLLRRQTAELLRRFLAVCRDDTATATFSFLRRSVLSFQSIDESTMAAFKEMSMALERPIDFREGSCTTAAGTLLMLAGLENPDMIDLAAPAMDLIYRQLESGLLKDDYWQALECELPRSPRLGPWTRAERLLHGVVERLFSKRRTSEVKIEYLLAAGWAGREIQHLLEDSKRGRRLLKSVSR